MLGGGLRNAEAHEKPLHTHGGFWKLHFWHLQRSQDHRQIRKAEFPLVRTAALPLLQVVSVSQQDGNCLKVAFRPNKPNRKRAEEEAVTALKAMLFPLWYPGAP